MTGHGREITDLHRRIRLFARTDAVYPVLHVVLIGSVARKSCTVLVIYFLREVARRRFRPARNHILLAGNVLDSSVAPKDVFAQPVAAVAEGGLPVHDQIIWEVEADGDSIRDFASILLGENAACHVGRGGNL